MSACHTLRPEATVENGVLVLIMYFDPEHMGRSTESSFDNSSMSITSPPLLLIHACADVLLVFNCHIEHYAIIASRWRPKSFRCFCVVHGLRFVENVKFSLPNQYLPTLCIVLSCCTSVGGDGCSAGCST